MSEGYEEGEREYLQIVREQQSRKKGGGRRGERGKGRCISSENKSYLRDEEGGAGGTEGGEEGVLLMTATLSQALFFSSRFRKSWQVV